MKGLFLFMCYFCAVLLSVLTVLMTIKPAATEKIAEESAGQIPFVTEPPSVYPEQKRAKEDLTQAIIARQEDLDRKEKALEKRESDLSSEKELLSKLQSELSKAKEEMDKDLTALDANERKNCKKLAEFYSKMDPNNAAQLLSEIEPERAALILTYLSDRDAGGIMDAAVALGPNGINRAVRWSEIIRKMKNQ